MEIKVGWYLTRRGHKARVLCIDAPSTYVVAGYIINDEGRSTIEEWTFDGNCRRDGTESFGDLLHEIDAPIVVKGWVNVYDHNIGGTVHSTEEKALEWAGSHGYRGTIYINANT
jgi:hypothetical protein